MPFKLFVKPLTILFLLLFFSCSKEVNISYPPHTPELVIGSYFTPASYIDVSITQTQLPNDTVFVIPNRVNAFISYDEKEYALKKVSESNWRSPFKAETNKTYTLKVFSESKKSLICSSSAPQAVAFHIDRWIPTYKLDNEGENISAFQITLLNVPKSRTYFELRMKSKKPFDENRFDYNFIESEDIVIRNEGIVNLIYHERKNSLLFSNELFTSKNKTLLFTFYNYLNDETSKITEAEIELRTVSPEYFEYKKKLYLNLANQVSDIWDGTGNPVEAYTNVKNGLGIFAGYSQTSEKYIIP